VDWERLAQSTALAIRFLDNVIDANIYPIDEIRDMVTNNRRVGLGIMGFADLLIQMQIAYGSPEAIAFAAKLMKFIQQRAEETSEVLARERGDFPNKHLSVWADDPRPRRNAALLSIAPTGTISMIAGCSFGCEPYFGMAYTKHVMKDAEGRPQHLYYVVPLFEEIAKDEGFFSEELLAAIEENRGSVKGLAEVPKNWQEVFTTSADVTVDQHIDMLAAFQNIRDNAVSKTINAPNDDTRENVARDLPCLRSRLQGLHVLSRRLAHRASRHVLERQRSRRRQPRRSRSRKLPPVTRTRAWNIFWCRDGLRYRCAARESECAARGK
jgi:ribonucleoside-diphosphate reductase alpha chain